MQVDSRLNQFLRAVGRRVWLTAIAEGLGWGLIVGGVVIWLGSDWNRSPSTLANILIVAALLGAVIGVISDPRRRRPTAALVESGVPGCDNLVFTAAELQREGQPSISRAISTLIESQANSRLADVVPSSVVPASRSLLLLSLGLAVAGSIFFRPIVISTVATVIGARTGELQDIRLTITPPSYSQQPSTTEKDPERIRVLQGSVVRISLLSSAPGVVLETLQGVDTLRRDEADRWVGEISVQENDFIALHTIPGEGLNSSSRLIGITSVPDLAPRVRITAPGKDLKLLDGNLVLDLILEAEDDLGLSQLSLRYTRVSGSGENFSFSDGEIPLTITRQDISHWNARAKWNLATLELEPGDLVVYRGVARDRRPGALPVESDAFIAEVLAPGSLALSGYDTDPEIERYALSQQMIILKTERLLEQMQSLSADSLATQAALIAAEQRSVRAEFVFMLGGEMESVAEEGSVNEEAHAEAEAEMMSGHQENQGQAALMRATRWMSHAIASLNLVQVEAALPQEKLALDELQKAFSHSRLLLRALSQQERLDFARRLTGPITDAARSVRPSPRPESEPAIQAKREVLGRIIALASGGIPDTRSEQFAALSEATLRIDPADSSLQQIASLLSSATSSWSQGDASGALDLLGEAASRLSRQIQDGPRQAITVPIPDQRRVRGRFRDASGGLR